MGNLTSCKIQTLKQIVTKFVTVDYVYEGNVRSKFGKNQLTGTSGQIGETSLSCDFCYFWARRDSIQPNSYGNVAGWLAGWLSVTAGIVSKRLNLS